MRRLTLGLLILLFLAGGALLFLRHRAKDRQVDAILPPPANPSSEPASPVATPAPVVVGPAPGFSPATTFARPEGHREGRAYRLVLDGNRCTLEAVEEIRGDFRRPRALARATGMLSCRLIDATGKPLAEETMPAPDHLCVVLDPNVPDASGQPAPIPYTTTGPVTFQTRLPHFTTAATLEVIRLSGAPAATPGDRPPGRLLASIPLARR